MEDKLISGIEQIEPGLTLILQVPNGQNRLAVILARPIPIVGTRDYLIPVSPLEVETESGDLELSSLRKITWLYSSTWIGGNYQMIMSCRWDLEELISEARFIVPNKPQSIEKLPYETKLEVQNLIEWLRSL
jgi:hypothetical protein